ncbi:hypothetical protein [Aeribacillus composti]|uniref:hypothetical protein n=1 Tax=Aeribacillus composti TaxID=1868734 RepID=UPI003D1DD321
MITELTNDILETSQRMNQLLINFLKLSKGEEDNIKETINVIAVIDELLSHLRKKNERSRDSGHQTICREKSICPCQQKRINTSVSKYFDKQYASYGTRRNFAD